MRRRFVVLWLAAIAASAAAFVAHLALRFETVRLGYEVDQARRDQARLVEQERLLAIEVATLRGSDRVEAIARGALGMDLPPPERVVTIDARTRRAVAGRMR